VMRVPEYSAASTTSSDGHAADDPIANGKILRGGKGSQGKLRNEDAAESENLFRGSRVFLGIDHVDPGAKYRDGLTFGPLGRDRAAVAGGVDAAGHTTNND
jgi:hypothetical protein